MYVCIEWDGWCKGLLRGEVEMFHTLVVGRGAGHAGDPHDSDDDVQGSGALNRLHLEKSENLLFLLPRRANVLSVTERVVLRHRAHSTRVCIKPKLLPSRLRISYLYSVWYVFVGLQCCD